jgi:hypothetical protein
MKEACGNMLKFENKNVEFIQEYVPEIRKEVIGVFMGTDPWYNRADAFTSADNRSIPYQSLSYYITSVLLCH